MVDFICLRKSLYWSKGKVGSPKSRVWMWSFFKRGGGGSMNIRVQIFSEKILTFQKSYSSFFFNQFCFIWDYLMSPAPHSDGWGGLHSAELMSRGLPNDWAMNTERTSTAFILGISARISIVASWFKYNDLSWQVRWKATYNKEIFAILFSCGRWCKQI